MLELMVVISVMLILISVTVPAYNRSVIRSRETILRHNLFTLRSVISQYTVDLQKAPKSLSDLISAGYLRQVPVDPITNSSATWQVVQEDVLQAANQLEPGITDVHSGSTATSSEGAPYSDW
jgi:general secretion pathway protein G